jgi:hypothetical protein
MQIEAFIKRQLNCQDWFLMAGIKASHTTRKRKKRCIMNDKTTTSTVLFFKRLFIIKGCRE